MKLLRWAAAGASVYAVYRYSIGKKAKGEDVLVSRDKAIADITGEDEAEQETEDKAEDTKSKGKKAKG